MRWIVAASVAAAVTLNVSPVHAESNNFLGQAQHLLGNDNDQNAYERGRQDELRQQQDHRAERRDRDRYGDRQDYRYGDYDRR